MPYIIETTPREPEGWEDDADFRPSRVAVATLDEARQDARNIVEDHAQRPGWTRPYIAARDKARALPDEGGTIGPLPNGTVIEVRRIEWQAMCDEAGTRPSGWEWESVAHREILDAYNAQ